MILEAGPAEEVLAVSTPVELQRAIENGSPHIQIRSHMALSALPLLPLTNSALTAVLGGIPSTVLSIQVPRLICRFCARRMHLHADVP